MYSMQYVLNSQLDLQIFHMNNNFVSDIYNIASIKLNSLQLTIVF